MLRSYTAGCLITLSLALSSCATAPQQTAQADPAEIARDVIEELAKPDAKTANTETTAEPVAPIWRLIGNGGGLEHIPSGYICPITSGDFKLQGEEAHTGLGHGNDVVCIYSAPEGGAVKLHLTNFGRDVSPSAHLKGVETSISDTHKISGRAQIPATSDRSSIANTAAFQLNRVSDLRPGIPVDTAVWITQSGPWHVKIRATYEADRAEAIASLVDDLYASAHDHIKNPARIALPALPND